MDAADEVSAPGDVDGHEDGHSNREAMSAMTPIPPACPCRSRRNPRGCFRRRTRLVALVLVYGESDREASARMAGARGGPGRRWGTGGAGRQCRSGALFRSIRRRFGSRRHRVRRRRGRRSTHPSHRAGWHGFHVRRRRVGLRRRDRRAGPVPHAVRPGDRCRGRALRRRHRQQPDPAHRARRRRHHAGRRGLEAGFRDGPGSLARFNGPIGVAVDADRPHHRRRHLQRSDPRHPPGWHGRDRRRHRRTRRCGRARTRSALRYAVRRGRGCRRQHIRRRYRQRRRSSDFSRWRCHDGWSAAAVRAAATDWDCRER